MARGVDAAVVEIVDGGRVDGRRQRKGVSNKTVLKLGNELRLPSEALDLPCAQEEGRNGDDGYDVGVSYAAGPSKQYIYRG